MKTDIAEQAGTLLVVENDVDFADSLEMILGGEGYSVTLCHDGAEAYELTQTESFDAVITDHRLPGMGGMELLGRMRDEQAQRPVIMMTSHGSANLAIESTCW